MKTLQVSFVFILSLFVVTACGKKADDAITIALHNHKTIRT